MRCVRPTEKQPVHGALALALKKLILYAAPAPITQTDFLGASAIALPVDEENLNNLSQIALNQILPFCQSSLKPRLNKNLSFVRKMHFQKAVCYLKSQLS